MSIRKVKPYGNSDFIQKTIDIERKIPLMYDLQDLSGHEKEFTQREYLSLYQSFAEVELWNGSSWEERGILAPLVDFFYDINNRPVLVYPRFEPLASEEDIFRFEEEEVVNELGLRLAKKGMTDEEIGIFIAKVIQFCEDYDMNQDDTLLNLNNLGWNSTFGVRIIDYGLSNEMIEKFYTKKVEDNNV